MCVVCLTCHLVVCMREHCACIKCQHVAQSSVHCKSLACVGSVRAMGKRGNKKPAPWSLPPRDERRQWIDAQDAELWNEKRQRFTAGQMAERNLMWREAEGSAAASSSEVPAAPIAGASQYEGDPRMKRLAHEWETARWSLTTAPASFNPLQYTRIVAGRPVQVSLL